MPTDPDSPSIIETNPELREFILSKLTEALGDPDPEVRRIAALNLGRVGDQAFRAVPAFAKILNDDPSPELRRLAASALAGLGARTLPFLFNALARSDPETYKAARDALTGHTIPRRDWMPILIQVTSDPDAFYRYHAITALFYALDRRIEDEFVFFDETTMDRAFETLRHSLTDPEEEIRLMAAYTLWIVFRDTSGVELVETATQHPDGPHYDIASKMLNAIHLGMENE